MKRSTFLSGALLSLSLQAFAAAPFPQGPIKVVVPFSAGSTGDMVIRLMAPKLGERLGQSLVIENRVGAGGNIGTGFVAAAVPDGQTLLFTAMHNFVINQHIYKTMKFDPVTAFAPVSKVVDLPYVMYASGGSKLRSVKDVTAAAKAGSVFFASSGVGTAPHLAGVMFSKMAGVPLVHVPYPGNPQSIQALKSNDVQLYFASASASTGQIGPGPRDLWPVAVTWDSRMREFPDAPTTAELGLLKLRISNWWGLAAPAKTPPETVELINKAVRAVLADPETSARLNSLGVTPAGDSPSEFHKAIRQESEVWAQLIKAENIQAE